MVYSRCSSDFALKVLSESVHIFLDGSFKFSPKGSHQVYRIFALVRETYCLPVVTLVMKRRQRSDYEEAFGQILGLIEDNELVLNTQFAHFDHESAAVLAFRQVLNSIQVSC